VPGPGCMHEDTGERAAVDAAAQQAVARAGTVRRCLVPGRKPSTLTLHTRASAATARARARQIGMLGVIISAVAIIMLGYLCVGLAGYLAFPTTVASNVLLSFPPDDWLMQACRP
jgi:hypothetical protein